MYHVIKHSAKGTTWGEHKYIRKEGNRYIYPEDVKKNGNAYKERQEELNEENTKTNMQQEKNLNDYLKTISKDLAVDTITVNEHERLYKNDPKYRELSDKYDVEFDTKHAGSYSPEYEKEKYLKTASENKQNKILSEAKTAVDEHRAKVEVKKSEDTLSKSDPRFANRTDTLSKTDPRFANRTDTLSKTDPRFANRTDTLSKTDPRFANRTDTLSKTDPRFKTSDALSKTDPRFKYTIKRNSDPADRYKVVRDKNDERRELAKRRANISDEVNRELYGNDEKSNKYYKDRRRAESIEAYKDAIKGKDTLNSTNSLNELKRAEELAKKRRDIRQRNRYVDYYNVGPLRIRQDTSLAARSKSAIGNPETKIKVVKKKKSNSGGGGGHRR